MFKDKKGQLCVHVAYYRDYCVFSHGVSPQPLLPQAAAFTGLERDASTRAWIELLSSNRLASLWKQTSFFSFHHWHVVWKGTEEQDDARVGWASGLQKDQVLFIDSFL